jgi:hypothetical protein
MSQDLQTAVAWSQLILAVATVLTLICFIIYTKATIDLRQATRDQVNVTQRLLTEEQRQTEQQIMPVLILSTAWNEASQLNECVVRNVGLGAALNSNTTPISPNNSVNFRLEHRSAIAAGASQNVRLLLGLDPKALGAPDIVRVLNYEGAVKEAPVVISYQGINGKWYKTNQTFLLTSDKKDLIIRFDNFSETP